MSQTVLYPLRFEPIFQYRLWGGRRLAALLSEPLPNNGPIGEAWILSDREDHASRIANGPLKGQNLGQLMEQFQDQLMGKLAQRFRRFPLLLKFLDAHEMLSVQVHPGYTHGGLRPASVRGEDRSVGGAGGRKRKPHLCGTESGHHCRYSPAIAYKR